ncbi:hypothetical protein [Luteococcus peritonei]|uniref:DUF5134 domain-containing protein n=1 Tax=Luteococcus peritonei TaxID=88874 RepID=A0ABW4RWD6_9ACTN
MFTLSAVPVKFVGLLVLFLFTTAWEAVRLSRATTRVGRTSVGLHLLMSVIMLLMVPRNVWRPFTQVVPTWVSAVLMGLGALWFCWLAVRSHGAHRAHAAGCVAMFAAMTWHLVAMIVKMRNMTMPMPGASASPMGGHPMDHGSMASPSPMASASSMGMDHSGMNHGGMDHGSMASGHGAMWWLAVIGLPLMAWLLYAALRDLVAVFTRPEARLDNLSGFAMNFGMFWMSTGLLVPVLPFFSHLAF